MHTTIQDRDIKRLKVNYRDLSQKPEAQWSIGIGGKPVEPYFMEDVKLLLLSEDHTEIVWETLVERMDVLRHRDANRETINRFPALLGMDVLRQFRLVLDARNEPIVGHIELDSLPFGDGR